MNSYLQMSAGQPEEDEITWGSDELPIEKLESKPRDGETDLQTVFLWMPVTVYCIWLVFELIFDYVVPSIPIDGPIITEEELTCLPLIKVVDDGQYTGAKLNSVVRMMRGLLEQKVPLQEFDVRTSFSPFLFFFPTSFYISVNICFSFLAEPSESWASGWLFNSSD